MTIDETSSQTTTDTPVDVGGASAADRVAAVMGRRKRGDAAKKATGRADWSSWPEYDAAANGLRNYWYPVYWSAELGRKPAAVRVCGEAVLGIQPPVAIAIFDSSTDRVGRRVAQFLRELLAKRVRFAVADEDPYQANRLVDGVRLDFDLAAHRRVGSVGDDRHQLTIGEVEGPGVVRAGDRAGELFLAHRQGHAAVRATIVESVGHAIGTTLQDHVFSAHANRSRLATELG